MVKYLIFEVSTDHVIEGQHKVTEFKKFLKIELDCELDRQSLDPIVNYVNEVLERMSVQTRGKSYTFSVDELVLILTKRKHYLGSGLVLSDTFGSRFAETKKYKYLSDSILDPQWKVNPGFTFHEDPKLREAPLILGGYFMRGLVVEEFPISCKNIIQQQSKPGDLLICLERPRGPRNENEKFVSFYGKN